MRRRRRPVLKTPEPLEGVLARAGEDRFARRRLPIARRVWVECVGARIADRAEPIFLDRGVLHGWRNDGAETALVSCVMIDATPVGAGATHK